MNVRPNFKGVYPIFERLHLSRSVPKEGTAERSLFDFMEKKMQKIYWCEDNGCKCSIQNARSLGKILKIDRHWHRKRLGHFVIDKSDPSPQRHDVSSK